MTSFPVKMLMAAIGLAFLVTTPADAQSRKQRKPAAATTGITVHPHYRGANLFPPGPVMYGNEYLGDDPDPFIRQQILRDLGAHFGGNF
jgi:hypothetical protein